MMNTNKEEILTMKSSGWQQDFLASIVVFLVALPLCMGIAIASGVPVSAGLMTGIIGGIVVGYLAGCPLQVSGPAAGLTVVIYEFVREFGLEMLGPVVLMAGVLQFLSGALKLGQWFRAVSPAVISGMLAGIGVLIFASQFHVMLDDSPKGTGVQNLMTIPSAIQKGIGIPELPTPEVRKLQRRIVQDLGDLHRRQVMLDEQITERLPDHQNAADAAYDVPLADLAQEQRKIADELEVLVEEAAGAFSADQGRLERVQTLGATALALTRRGADDLEANQGRELMEYLRETPESIDNLLGAFKNHRLAAWIGILTILILVGWKSLARGRLAMVPAPLLGVLAATVVATIWQFPVIYVEVPDSLIQEMHFLTPALISDIPWGELMSAAALIAVIASAETLLCATAVDQLHSGPRTKYDQELMAQGVGNFVCGLVGALPMTGVIVRSSANVQAGGKTRRSAMLHGVWLLLFVTVLGTLLRMIPTSALAAMLVYTGYKLVDWKAIRKLAEFGWGEVVVYAATVIVIVVEDLLSGVVVGIVLATVKLLYTFSHLKIEMRTNPDGSVTMRPIGAATFLKLPYVANKLESVPAGAKLKLDIEQLTHIDHACLDLLSNWEQQHTATGGTLTIDWNSLNALAQNGGRVTAAEKKSISDEKRHSAAS